MDADRFRAWLGAISESPSRRAVASLLGSGLIGSALAALGLTDAEAKKKKRKKRKKQCAKAGQAPKKKKRCCRGLVEDTTGRCNPPCDVCQPAGACAFDTVQAAIDATPHLSTIRICPGIYVGNLILEGARSLTLVGAGDGVAEAANTILEGTGSPQVVHVDTEIDLTLQDLLIRGGNALYGGGIHNFGRLALIDSTVTSNTASYGGGIMNNSFAELILNNSNVIGNRASISGGGISNDNGTVTLTNSTVVGNSALFRGGGILTTQGTVSMDAASRVVLNEANPNNPDGGGGVYSANGTVTLSSPANISGNTPDQCGGDPVPLCSG